MAGASADLERDISALSKADKEKPLHFLMLDKESPPADLRAHVREFAVAVNRQVGRSIRRSLTLRAGTNE